MDVTGIQFAPLLDWRLVAGFAVLAFSNFELNAGMGLLSALTIAVALVRLGNMAQIDALFTDRAPPASMRAMLAAAGLEIHVARGRAAAAE